MCVIVARRQRQRGEGAREEDWQQEDERERERRRRAASAFSRSVCLPVALPRHSPPCDGLWEVMTHDNFHCCIQTRGETQQSGRQVSHSGASSFHLSFHLVSWLLALLPPLLSLASFFSHTVASRRTSRRSWRSSTSTYMHQKLIFAICWHDLPRSLNNRLKQYHLLNNLSRTLVWFWWHFTISAKIWGHANNTRTKREGARHMKTTGFTQHSFISNLRMFVSVEVDVLTPQKVLFLFKTTLQSVFLSMLTSSLFTLLHFTPSFANVIITTTTRGRCKAKKRKHASY